MRGHACRHRLEDERERASSLELSRIGEQLARCGSGPALGLHAAKLGGRLRGEPQMSHDRNSGADDGTNAGGHRSGTLQLDGVRASLHQAHRIGDRVLVRSLERAKRHVADDQRVRLRARDRGREHDRLVHADWHRGLVAENVVAGRVANQDQIDAGLRGEPRRGVVIRGDHHDLRAGMLHRRHFGQGERVSLLDVGHSRSVLFGGRVVNAGAFPFTPVRGAHCR
jgi:hypothetical protein